MQELINKLKLVDDTLDVEGFNPEGPARKTIAEVRLFIQQLLNKHDVMLSLPEKLQKQIEFGNAQQVNAERDGDDKGSEAWYGYVRALRWMEQELKGNAT
jgi:hypothetical protein